MSRVAYAFVVACGTCCAVPSVHAQSQSAPIWRGAYLGADLHAGRDRYSVDGATVDLNNLGIGLYTGYNFQLASFVAGVEADVDRRLGQASLSVPSYGAKLESTTPFLASARGRIGYATGPALFYLTGGVALLEAKVKARISIGGTAYKGELNDSATGFVYGGGIEYNLTHSLSARIEGLHYEFSDVFAKGVDFNTTTLRVGLTYNFNFN